MIIGSFINLYFVICEKRSETVSVRIIECRCWSCRPGTGRHRQSSLSFDIPFDRQQLADFLCVERAAMSVELSKLQKEGLLVTKRNHFELLTR